MYSFLSYFYVFHTSSFFFFFNDTATTEIYTLSLHDALPILGDPLASCSGVNPAACISLTTCKEMRPYGLTETGPERSGRSEEHTSELQSQSNLVCRLLLEKKKKKKKKTNTPYKTTV